MQACTTHAVGDRIHAVVSVGAHLKPPLLQVEKSKLFLGHALCVLYIVQELLLRYLLSVSLLRHRQMSQTQVVGSLAAPR